MASRRAAERGVMGLGAVRHRKDSVWCHPMVMWIYTCAGSRERLQGLAAVLTERLWPGANFLTFSCEGE